ncbi:MAG: DinB family protein [Gemmatimonadaceae bacterium]
MTNSASPASSVSPASTQSAAPLNARFSEIVAYLAQERAELEAYVLSLPESSLQRRAHPERWSVAEMLEHLVIVEDGSGRLVSKLVKQAVEEGAVQETDFSSKLGCLDMYYVDGVKIVAPSFLTPDKQIPVADSLAALRVTRERLLVAIQKANGLDMTRVKGPHPLFGPIDGYQWIVMIGKHEERHLHQMKDTVNALTN